MLGYRRGVAVPLEDVRAGDPPHREFALGDGNLGRVRDVDPDDGLASRLVTAEDAEGIVMAGLDDATQLFVVEGETI